MNHQEAAEFVQKHRQQGKSAPDIANALVREALNKKTEDNVTVIVVFFTWEGRQEAKATETTPAPAAADAQPSTPTDAAPTETPAQ
jgi:serine/threonine protein phosphatase PrpC